MAKEKKYSKHKKSRDKEKSHKSRDNHKSSDKSKRSDKEKKKKKESSKSLPSFVVPKTQSVVIKKEPSPLHPVTELHDAITKQVKQEVSSPETISMQPRENVFSAVRLGPAPVDVHLQDPVLVKRAKIEFPSPIKKQPVKPSNGKFDVVIVKTDSDQASVNTNGSTLKLKRNTFRDYVEVKDFAKEKDLQISSLNDKILQQGIRTKVLEQKLKDKEDETENLKKAIDVHATELRGIKEKHSTEIDSLKETHLTEMKLLKEVIEKNDKLIREKNLRIRELENKVEDYKKAKSKYKKLTKDLELSEEKVLRRSHVVEEEKDNKISRLEDELVRVNAHLARTREQLASDRRDREEKARNNFKKVDIVLEPHNEADSLPLSRTMAKKKFAFPENAAKLFEPEKRPPTLVDRETFNAYLNSTLEDIRTNFMDTTVCRRCVTGAISDTNDADGALLRNTLELVQKVKDIQQAIGQTETFAEFHRNVSEAVSDYRSQLEVSACNVRRMQNELMTIRIFEGQALQILLKASRNAPVLKETTNSDIITSTS